MMSKTVRNYLRRIGKKGGNQRARNLSVNARSSQAQNAVIMRWIHKRFGVHHFVDMGLPGCDVVDSGLRDLVNGNLSSVNALAVAEVRPKLRFLGVPVPNVSGQISNSRSLLYHNIEKIHGDMAHVRFCALLERVDSFCHALAAVAPIPKISTHRHRRWCQ